MVPARRHSHTRDSYSNRGGGERDMVRSLTHEPLALGIGRILDGLDQARVIVVARLQVASRLRQPVKLDQFAPSVRLGEASAHGTNSIPYGERRKLVPLGE